MSFYMAEPSERLGFLRKPENLVWKDSDFEAYAYNRLYLFKGKIFLAELVSGTEGLKKYYKGDFSVWRDKIKHKDLEKSKKMRQEAKDLLQRCVEIDRMWGSQDDHKCEAEG